jgi:hypothetical protein
MIVVISPSKSMNFEQPAPVNEFTQPIFEKGADYLAKRLQKFTPAQLSDFLKVSTKLAQLNAERYAQWKNATAKQAIYAYNGDVYAGLQAITLNVDEIAFASKHLRIISGLYGLLNPLDHIKPYRLDMGTALETPKGKDLYTFWSDRITLQLNKAILSSNSAVLINLASQEYFSALNTRKLKARIITPVFKDRGNNGYAVVSLFAKRARGMMTKFIINNKITDFEMIIGFDSGGYHFNHGLSKGDTWVFTRG